MACFVVPAAEAVVVKVIERAQSKKEKELKLDRTGDAAVSHASAESRIPFSRKLRWLTRLLIGGSVLLAFEHVWHGEVEPWFPFLTAAATPETTSVMLKEMATTGVGMAVIVTLVWVAVCKLADRSVKKLEEEKEIL